MTLTGCPRICFVAVCSSSDLIPGPVNVCLRHLARLSLLGLQAVAYIRVIIDPRAQRHSRALLPSFLVACMSSAVTAHAVRLMHDIWKSVQASSLCSSGYEALCGKHSSMWAEGALACSCMLAVVDIWHTAAAETSGCRWTCILWSSQFRLININSCTRR